MISPFTFKPDLLLVIVVVAALLRGPKIGIAVGLAAGCLQDLFLGGFLGILTVTKMISGGLAGLIEGQIFKQNYLLPPVIVFFFTFIHEGINILISEKLLFRVHLIPVLKQQILPEALLNGLIAFIIYLVLYKLDRAGGSYHE